MMNEHTAPYRVRLEDHPGLVGKVDDVVRVKTTGEFVRANYVVLSVNLPEYVDPRLAGGAPPNADQSVEVHVRAVATTVQGVNLLTDAVNEQLQDFRAVVAGRDVTPLHRDELEDVVHDRPPVDLYSRDAWYTATTSRT